MNDENQILQRLGARIERHRLGPLRVQGRMPGSVGVAIVGSRRANPHGLELAGRVARAAVARGHHVVSGGALGIDAAAHAAALEAGGETVVVLGSGLDRPTPAAHRRLFARARERGAVVSPFRCGTRAAPWTFPRRNPWIAALAESVVVVQATAGSGALYTARAALESEQPVLVVPGTFDDPLHAGCHQLANEGARLLSPGDLVGPADAALEPAGSVVDAPTVGLELWRVASGEAELLGVLAERAALTTPEAAAMATELELGGWLRACRGGRYARRFR